jgi:hypothetical protein
MRSEKAVHRRTSWYDEAARTDIGFLQSSDRHAVERERAGDDADLSLLATIGR